MKKTTRKDAYTYAIDRVQYDLGVANNYIDKDEEIQNTMRKDAFDKVCLWTSNSLASNKRYVILNISELIGSDESKHTDLFTTLKDATLEIYSVGVQLHFAKHAASDPCKYVSIQNVVSGKSIKFNKIDADNIIHSEFIIALTVRESNVLDRIFRENTTFEGNEEAIKIAKNYLISLGYIDGHADTTKGEK